MSNCQTIKDITERLIKGESAEDVIPFDVDLDKDCYIEILMLYIKYGKDENRINICKEKLKEVK